MCVHQYIDFAPHMRTRAAHASAPTAVSLFSCAGVGDTGLDAAGFRILVSNELHADRHSTYARNHPHTTLVTGDIRSCADEIVRAAESRLSGASLDLLVATPPCQGMSSAGRGHRARRAAKCSDAAPDDPRNELVLPALHLARRLSPRFVVIENVPAALKTRISIGPLSSGTILDAARAVLPAYSVSAHVVQMADYGVAEHRRRLIVILQRPDATGRPPPCPLPAPTHSSTATDDRERWVTLRDCIGGMPPPEVMPAIRKAAEASDALHIVRVLSSQAQPWVRATPADGGHAVDNQCSAPGCACVNTPRDTGAPHRTRLLRCCECDAVLPRPSRHGRPLKIFATAYSRMRWDRPAPTVTRNVLLPSSDSKLHPSEHRTLSVREACMVHSVPTSFDWADHSAASVALLLAESVPPRFMEALARHLLVLGQRCTEQEGSHG